MREAIGAYYDALLEERPDVVVENYQHLLEQEFTADDFTRVLGLLEDKYSTEFQAEQEARAKYLIELYSQLADLQARSARLIQQKQAGDTRAALNEEIEQLNSAIQDILAEIQQKQLGSLGDYALTNYEEVVCATLYHQTYQQKFPRLINYREVQLRNGMEFADCVATAVRNLFNIFISSVEQDSLIFDLGLLERLAQRFTLVSHVSQQEEADATELRKAMKSFLRRSHPRKKFLPLRLHQHLVNFYKGSDLQTAHLSNAHSAWAECVSNIPEVTYAQELRVGGTLQETDFVFRDALPGEGLFLPDTLGYQVRVIRTQVPDDSYVAEIMPDEKNIVGIFNYLLFQHKRAERDGWMSEERPEHFSYKDKESFSFLYRSTYQEGMFQSMEDVCAFFGATCIREPIHQGAEIKSNNVRFNIFLPKQGALLPRVCAFVLKPHHAQMEFKFSLPVRKNYAQQMLSEFLSLKDAPYQVANLACLHARYFYPHELAAILQRAENYQQSTVIPCLFARSLNNNDQRSSTLKSILTLARLASGEQRDRLLEYARSLINGFVQLFGFAMPNDPYYMVQIVKTIFSTQAHTIDGDLRGYVEKGDYQSEIFMPLLRWILHTRIFVESVEARDFFERYLQQCSVEQRGQLAVFLLSELTKGTSVERAALADDITNNRLPFGALLEHGLQLNKLQALTALRLVAQVENLSTVPQAVRKYILYSLITLGEQRQEYPLKVLYELVSRLTDMFSQHELQQEEKELCLDIIGRLCATILKKAAGELEEYDFPELVQKLTKIIRKGIVQNLLQVEQIFNLFSQAVERYFTQEELHKIIAAIVRQGSDRENECRFLTVCARKYEDKQILLEFIVEMIDTVNINYVRTACNVALEQFEHFSVEQANALILLLVERIEQSVTAEEGEDPILNSLCALFLRLVPLLSVQLKPQLAERFELLGSDDRVRVYTDPLIETLRQASEGSSEYYSSSGEEKDSSDGSFVAAWLSTITHLLSHGISLVRHGLTAVLTLFGT